MSFFSEVETFTCLDLSSFLNETMYEAISRECKKCKYYKKLATMTKEQKLRSLGTIIY